MVSIIWGVLAFSIGLLFYLLPAVLAPALPVNMRKKIGDFYFRNSMRSFAQVAFVRRLLTGYELIPVGVDDEHKTAQVTLSSGIISDDKQLPFRDPDDRIKRMYKKPVALIIEDVPAAIDAELAELGHWVRQHDVEEGFEQTITGRADGGTVELRAVKPYFEVGRGLRLAEPLDALHLVSKDIAPENIESAKQFTKQRFSEYGSKVGVAEMASTFTGFAAGLIGVATLKYFNQKILDGSGGSGGNVNPIPPIGGVALPPVDLMSVANAGLAHVNILLMGGI